jgi:hypothetical protein
MFTIADETAATIAIDRAWLGKSMTCGIRFANLLRGIANQTWATIGVGRAGIVESLAKSDAREVFGIAHQLSAATRVDSAWAADLMARIQANLPVRVAEEPIATLSIRAGLIALRAGARLAAAPLLREILIPWQALATAKDIILGTARTERIVGEAPGIWRTRFAGVRRSAAARHSTRGATITIAMAVIWLDQEARRSWAIMRNRLAKRIGCAWGTTDALRAEGIATGRRGAGTTVPALRGRPAEVVASLAYPVGLLANAAETEISFIAIGAVAALGALTVATAEEVAAIFLAAVFRDVASSLAADLIARAR